MTLQQIVKVSILSSALFVIGCSSQTTEPTVIQVKAPTTMTPSQKANPLATHGVVT